MQKKLDLVSILLGVTAVGATGAYLYRATQGKGINSLQGINLTINPEKLIDASKPFIHKNPIYQEVFADMGKKFIQGFMAQRIDEE
jgi:hypothetical protein